MNFFAGEEGFLILASYAGARHPWRPIGVEDLLDPHCPAANMPAAERRAAHARR
jgi:hypothetical protein